MSTKVHYTYCRAGHNVYAMCGRKWSGRMRTSITFEGLTCKDCINKLIRQAERDLKEIQDDIEHLRSLG